MEGSAGIGVGFMAVFAVSGSAVLIALQLHKRLLSDFMKKIESEIGGMCTLFSDFHASPGWSCLQYILILKSPWDFPLQVPEITRQRKRSGLRKRWWNHPLITKNTDWNTPRRPRELAELHQWKRWRTPCPSTGVFCTKGL